MKKITTRILRATSLNRTYPKRILLNAINNAKTMINENRMFVSAKCPETSTIPLVDVIGIIKKLTLKDDGVYADIEFLDTPAYKMVHETFRAISNLNLTDDAFSSIGLGSVKKNKKKMEIVQSDYELCGAYLK